MLFKNIQSSWSHGKAEILLLEFIVFILEINLKSTFPGPGFLWSWGMR